MFFLSKSLRKIKWFANLKNLSTEQSKCYFFFNFFTQLYGHIYRHKVRLQPWIIDTKILSGQIRQLAFFSCHQSITMLLLANQIVKCNNDLFKLIFFWKPIKICNDCNNLFIMHQADNFHFYTFSQILLTKSFKKFDIFY